MPTAARLAATSAAAASLACLLLAGCRITESGSGQNKKVDIGTPFGSMKVNTNDAADLAAIGISAYPGAVPDKENGDDNHSNADVNMSFGDFHLGVKAASFTTPDAPAKVLAFYRADLAKRYGDVIQCRHNQPVGTPTRTAQGLTCSDTKGTHVNADDDDTRKPGLHLKGTLNGHSIDTDDTEDLNLRAGSQEHQHIVGVHSRNGGTKIALVALDLPSHLGDHDKEPE